MQAQNTIRSIVYHIPSDSHPGTFHAVTVDPADGRMTCPCPARGDCWHQKAIRTGLAGKPTICISQRPVRDPMRVEVSAAGRDLQSALEV